MKAQKVFENIAFKRGIDSKTSLGVGEEKIRQNWWEEFKNSFGPIDQFEEIILNLIKENTDFVDTWAQTTSGHRIPGKITYVLDRSHPAKKKILYVSLDTEGEVTWNNGLRRMGNLTDLLFPEDKAKFIENLKEIDDYYEG